MAKKGLEVGLDLTLLKGRVLDLDFNVVEYMERRNACAQKSERLPRELRTRGNSRKKYISIKQLSE